MMETTPSFLKPFSLIKHSTNILINSNSTYNNINTNFIKFCRKDSNYYLRSCSIQCVTNSRKWSIIELKNDEEEERKNQVIETCISWNGILGLLLLVLTTTFETESALAASGGRIGGSSFSSSSSSSTSSSSSSSSSLSSWDSSDSYTWSRSRPDNVTYHTSTTYAYAPPLRVWRNFDVGLYIYWSMIVMIVCWFVSAMVEDTLQNRTSVIKLQVCLLGTARSLQTDLERLAEVADTSNSEGLNYILKEATLSLLRHPDFCIFGYSSIDLKHSPKDGEKLFNRFSIEERGKFDEETLSNVNNVKRKTGTRRQSESGSTNEYIVMTILVAAAGSQDLPIISSSADLKEALHKLGSISSKQTLAVEVLWTPQEENDTLSEQELLVKYPLLRSLH